MKFTIYYHRDTKEMLWADTLNAGSDVPEDLAHKVYVLNEHAFDGTIPGFLKFSINTELPVYEFEALFADKALEIC